MFLPALSPYTIHSPPDQLISTGLVCFCPDALEVLSFIKLVRRTAPRGLLHGDFLCLDCYFPRFPQSSFCLSVCSSSFFLRLSCTAHSELQMSQYPPALWTPNLHPFLRYRNTAERGVHAHYYRVRSRRVAVKMKPKR